MIFEVAEIEPGESGVDDVTIMVRYYEGDTPVGTPIYEEEHEILGVPDAARGPKVTPLGQFIGLDGSPVSPWKTVDGELVLIDPLEIEDQIQWEEESEEDLVMAPLRSRAREVKEQDLRGRDVGRMGASSRRRTQTESGVAGRVAGLRGRFEEI